MGKYIGSNNQMSEIQFGHLLNCPTFFIDKDDGSMSNPEHIISPLATTHDFYGTPDDEDLRLIGDSSCIASCKKSRILSNPNTWKKSLTYSVPCECYREICRRI